MFGWSKKGYAGLPLEKMRFLSEDLFTMLGGTDAQLYVCSSSTMNFDEVEDKAVTDRWRRNVVARYQQLGLVDGEGNPVGKMAEALAPVAKPGIVIANAHDPSSRDRDQRTAVVYRWGDYATGIRRAEGFKGGWYVVPFGPRENWNQAFLEFMGIEGFAYSPYDQHVAYSDDLNHSYAQGILAGNVNAVGQWAASHGVAPEPLQSVAAAYAQGPRVAPRPTELFVTDWRRCKFRVVSGFMIGVPEQGSVFASADAQLLAAAGFAFAGAHEARTEDPGTPVRQWGRFDFLPSGSIFDYVSTLAVYPSAASEGGAAAASE